MKNKTATECWNMLTSELDNAIDRCVPIKSKGNGLRNLCQKRLSERLDLNKICGVFINIREMLKIMKFTRRH